MAKKYTISIAGTNGIPANYGGFETLAEQLYLNLNKDFNIVVYCSKAHSKKWHNMLKNVELIYLPFKANGWQSIFFDSACLIHSFFKSDICLMLGNSGGLLMPIMSICKRKVIINVGGLESIRAKYKPITRAFVYLLETLSNQFSTKTIVDNMHIKKIYDKRFSRECIYIPYGGDHAKKNLLTESYIKKYDFLKSNYFLSVSRAQPDNNIHLLIESFIDLPDKKLVIISNWNVSEYGVDLYKKFNKKYKNIILLHAIYEKKELDTLRSNCFVYIHSHSACGTAPSLVEAMCLNVPVICFDCETNRNTTDGLSKYFIDKKSLKNLVLLSDNSSITDEIKTNLYKLGQKKYNWKRVSQQYKELFLSILEGNT